MICFSERLSSRCLHLEIRDSLAGILSPIQEAQIKNHRWYRAEGSAKTGKISILKVLHVLQCSVRISFSFFHPFSRAHPESPDSAFSDSGVWESSIFWISYPSSLDFKSAESEVKTDVPWIESRFDWRSLMQKQITYPIQNQKSSGRSSLLFPASFRSPIPCGSGQFTNRPAAVSERVNRHTAFEMDSNVFSAHGNQNSCTARITIWFRRYPASSWLSLLESSCTGIFPKRRKT